MTTYDDYKQRVRDLLADDPELSVPPNLKEVQDRIRAKKSQMAMTQDQVLEFIVDGIQNMDVNLKTIQPFPDED
jgi:hypothetical protein